nr:MAG TPA: hypothetical protein [Caudoviricetes sp.]
MPHPLTAHQKGAPPGKTNSVPTKRPAATSAIM